MTLVDSHWMPLVDSLKNEDGGGIYDVCIVNIYIYIRIYIMKKYKPHLYIIHIYLYIYMYIRRIY